MTSGAGPMFSVIMPTYESHVTLGGTLEALRSQTFRDFEVIVVDSGPTGGVAEVVARFPEVRFHRSPVRLLPHAARNRGAALARGAWLVFTDPDVYAHPAWLERLAAASAKNEVVVGAVACYGDKWVDRGVHFGKYHSWLPGGASHATYAVQSANLLCSRRVWHAIGGLPEDSFTGDATLGWWLERRGEPALFAADAVVHHHHLTSARGFFAERLLRGNEIAERRATFARFGAAALALRIALTVTGVRAVRIAAIRLARALRASWMLQALWTLPVWLPGELAWEAGEARGYLRMLRTAR